jgi:hypothetical protein
MTKHNFPLFSVLTSFILTATLFQNQGKIYLSNPSFEDKPRASASPVGWYSGVPGSTPDILPGAWGLNLPAQDGKTCLGLVTRSDNSAESISQELPAVLKSGECYKFEIWLAHAEQYVGFNKPCRIRVWGSGSKTDKGQLLTSSPLVSHSDWRLYKLRFTTSSEIRFITLEAWYGPGVTFQYNGNILLDNCSPIELCERA